VNEGAPSAVRIVSVLPSATETVAALGLRRDLVGRSAECDAPADVRRLPVVMRPRSFDGDRRSADIDARVRGMRSSSESLYVLDVPLLARLRPDLILTQDLCGVCSVTDAEVVAACRLAGIDPRIVSLTPRTLSEVADTIVTIGAAVGAPGAARQLAAPLRESATDSTREGRPRVAVVEWLDPPILAGLWVPEMIALAGGTPVGPAAGAVGERTSWLGILRRQPDLIVVSPCSFSVERTVRELSASALGDRLLTTGARRGVWVADEAYFSRPGPRLADGIAVLRTLVGSGRADRPMALQRWDPPRAAMETAP
jgi:iron complex transport system substrate-binding protein